VRAKETLPLGLPDSGSLDLHLGEWPAKWGVFSRLTVSTTSTRGNETHSTHYRLPIWRGSAFDSTACCEAGYVWWRLREGIEGDLSRFSPRKRALNAGVRLAECPFTRNVSRGFGLGFHHNQVNTMTKFSSALKGSLELRLLCHLSVVSGMEFYTAPQHAHEERGSTRDFVPW
jgi:hypothetical protein